MYINIYKYLIIISWEDIIMLKIFIYIYIHYISIIEVYFNYT